ncbi:MAG: hypothetical protein ACI9PP_001478, partial [Halobacteriales archaeon]
RLARTDNDYLYPVAKILQSVSDNSSGGRFDA